MNDSLKWAVEVMKDDVRLYFAPFRGAIRGAIEEVRLELVRRRQRDDRYDAQAENLAGLDCDKP